MQAELKSFSEEAICCIILSEQASRFVCRAALSVMRKLRNSAILLSSRVKLNMMRQFEKEIEEKAVTDKKANAFEDGGEENVYDQLFEKAAEVVRETGQASTSFLQRKLSVGYARGAKIIDQLQEYGVIGPAEGSKPRKASMTKQMWLEKRAYDSGKRFYCR